MNHASEPGFDRTGREDTIVFWCQTCGFRLPDKPWPIAEARRYRCERDDAHGPMRYVAYEKGAEDHEAETLIRAGSP